MDRQERFDFRRFCETASDRQLHQQLLDLQYVMEIAANQDELRDTRWMLRVLEEEISARKEVRAYLERRSR